jgi:hypothetical protein
MKRARLLVLPAMALTLAVLLSGGAAAGNVSFTDPAGDSGTAPDITSITVSDDPATGTAMLTVTTASAITSGESIDVYLDTDKNGSTGAAGYGYDYYLEAWKAANDQGWDIERWKDGGWQEAPSTQTERFSRSGTVYTWTFSKADLGGSAGFDFVVGGYLDSDTGNVATDFAPDDGGWTFNFTKAAIVYPALGKPFAVPSSPLAGKLLSLSFPVVRADTGARLTGGGAVVIKTTIGGKAIPNVASLANATANVAVQIPRSAKGKTFQVKVTVTVQGKSATRTATYTVNG